MRLLAPVNTYESAIAISEYADEVYVGADDETFSKFSFTGRGKYSYNNLKVLNHFKDLTEIIQVLHTKDIQVNFVANYPHFHNGLYNDKFLEEYFLKYVESGIEAGADSVIVGDIGLLRLLKSMNYPVKLHASVYFDTFNTEQVLLLKELGADRITLSYHVTMEEIQEILRLNVMEIEVFGYLGCSFFTHTCAFFHDYGEGLNGGFYPGFTCKSKFCVSDSMSDSASDTRIFDIEAGCALCKLAELEESGVHVLKITGRDRDYQHTIKVLELIRDYMKDETTAIPSWWRKMWCSELRCKYSELNPNNKFLIR